MVLDEQVAHVCQADVAFGFDEERPSWREAHAKLKSIAKRRAALDADEAKWLLIARDAGVHRELGYGSFLEYVERELRAALEHGELGHSAVRELSRVAQPDTEAELIDGARGKTVRELADSAREDEPWTRRLTLELSPDVYAKFVATKRRLQEDTGESLDDSAVMAAVLEGDSGPRHQLAMTVCPRCEGATIDAAGEVIAVGPGAVSHARCDATHVGHDGKVALDIPQRVRRVVERRDHGRCRVPGCRISIGLHLHHLDERAQGGGRGAPSRAPRREAAHRW